jgi:type IV pilus assembly protein PilA
MNKKGFTLIELLAIIVILAIIAVITVPIILNIIENSKKGAAQDSAYGFKDAVEKYYVAQLYDSKDLKLVGTYDVLNGVLKGNSFPTEGVLIPTDGTIPTSGYLEYEDNKLKSGCLVIDEYAVTFDGSKVSGVSKEMCGSSGNNEVEPDLTGIDYTLQGDGYKYIDSSYVADNAIYFNPTTNRVCNRPEDEDKYVNDNSRAGVTTGCLRWFAYSVKGNVANLLLDHKVSPKDSIILWLNSTDASNAATLAPQLGVSNIDGATGRQAKGPLTALNYLKTATSNWNTSVIGDYKIYQADVSTAKFKVDYSDYTARLITQQELGNITGRVNYDERTDTGEDFIQDLPSWVYKGTFSDSASFWTVSPSCNLEYQDPFAVTDSSVLNLHTDETYGIKVGIRPVITIPANLIF